MTEVEWLSCDDPFAMMRFLHYTSDRKRRLFVVAWARAIWEQNPDSNLRESIRKAESYGDGLVGDAERFEQLLAMEEAIVTMLRFGYGDGSHEDPRAIVARGSWQNCLHEIFGNPFRPVTIDPSWRTSTALALAKGIYDERAFDRLPILADALQDAACNNEDLLNHLRDAAAPHVRGCWALDLVLGKE